MLPTRGSGCLQAADSAAWPGWTPDGSAGCERRIKLGNFVDDPVTETRHGDAWRRNRTHLASAGRLPPSGLTAGECDAEDQVSFDLAGPAPEEGFVQAVEAKKRDNLVLGETMVRIGLLARHELAAVQTAQARSGDTVRSLLVASAIRSRLGEMLLNSRRISSRRLEAALALLREEGGLLGEILLGQGWLDRDTLDAALALQTTRTAA
ncbi:MAG: hypothetical protein ACREYB_09175 [Casimicrobiaceae bacterium]